MRVGADALSIDPGDQVHEDAKDRYEQKCCHPRLKTQQYRPLHRCEFTTNDPRPDLFEEWMKNLRWQRIPDGSLGSECADDPEAAKEEEDPTFGTGELMVHQRGVRQ